MNNQREDFTLLRTQKCYTLTQSFFIENMFKNIFYYVLLLLLLSSSPKSCVGIRLWSRLRSVTLHSHAYFGQYLKNKH